MSYFSELSPSNDNQFDENNLSDEENEADRRNNLYLAFQQGYKGKRNWNEEFQRLKEREHEDLDPQAEQERIQKLRELCDEFAEVAKRIGKKIVSELFLPSTEKSILPKTSSLGGKAGGEKYVEEGIFFKFPVDKEGLYNGDEHIIKSAGHEFLSLLELMDCRIKGLHFPLIVLIDYLGYRLIAESILPLSDNSLVMGSRDGGKSIHNDNPQMTSIMQTVAKILNLQPHYVWNWTKTKKYLIYIALDCEGHLGTDGRFYLIDVARVFPPSTPIPKEKGCYLYRHLRPELVRNSHIPLCSDAFSTFNIENKEKYNKDIESITNTLLTEIIPNAAIYLCDYYKKTPLNELSLFEEFPKLISLVHRRGINIRFLGVLRSHCVLLELKNFILTEIVARSVKNTLRAHLRTLKTHDMSQYKSIILSYFNLLFGRKQKTCIYWQSVVKDSVSKRFSNVFTKEETKTDFDLRPRIFMVALYQRLQILMGVTFNPSIIKNFSLDNTGIPSLESNINPSDFLNMYPIVKHMHRIFFEEGLVLSKKAVEEAKTRIDFSTQLFDKAEQKYKESLQIKPDDYRALHAWGLSLQTKAFTKTGEEQQILFELAAQKYQEALEINKKDYHALFLWGNMLLEQARKGEKNSSSPASLVQISNYLSLACKKFAHSFEINPDNFQLLYNWGNALLYRSQLEVIDAELLLASACEKFTLALEQKPNDYNCQKNFGVALSKLARLKKGKEAEELFKQMEIKFQNCLKLKPNDHELFFNFGNALYRWARIKEFTQTRYQEYNKLLIQSGEKYWSALNIKLNHDALYNWGKVITCQIQLANEVDMPTDEFSRLLFSIEVYLEIFKKCVLQFLSEIKFKPLIAIFKIGNDQIKGKVAALLNQLSESQDLKVSQTCVQILNSFQPILKELGINLKNFESTCSPVVALISGLGETKDQSLTSNGNPSDTLPTILAKEKKSKFGGFSVVFPETKNTKDEEVESNSSKGEEKSTESGGYYFGDDPIEEWSDQSSQI